MHVLPVAVSDDRCKTFLCVTDEVDSGYGDGFVTDLPSGYDFDNSAEYNMIIHPTVDRARNF